MGPTELLAELTRRGVEVAVDGDRLRFRPQSAVTPDLRAALIEHKPGLIRLLADEDREVEWRIQFMRSQLRPNGPIPFLVSRSNLSDTPGVCLSCDGPLGEGHLYRCGLCVRAVEQILHEVREGSRHAGPR